MQEQRTFKYNKFVVAEDSLLISNYNTVMELPFFLRAVINTSSKEYLTEKRQSVNALAACFLLSAQKSTPTRAKKSIAAFKLREGALLGSRTTLRKKELHTILDKLLIFVLPRLYSEKQNNTISELANRLFLNKNTKKAISLQTQQTSMTTVNVGTLFLEKETLDIEKSDCPKTELLSQEEKRQLGINLTFFKEGVGALRTLRTLQSKGRRGRDTLEHSSAVFEDYSLPPRFIHASSTLPPRFLHNVEDRGKRRASLGKQLKDQKKGSKGPLYHLTLGIKDLLLMPEMQEFSPLFESIRGLNIGVTLSSPRIKKTYLPERMTFLEQKLTNQELASHVFSREGLNSSTITRNLSNEIYGNKVKGKLFEEEKGKTSTFTYNKGKVKEAETVTFSFPTKGVMKSSTVLGHKVETKTKLQPFTYKKDRFDLKKAPNKGLNNLPEKKTQTLIKKAKLYFAQKQNREKDRAFNTFCTPLDTSYSKQVRKNFFLTCFQYPSQYS